MTGRLFSPKGCNPPRISSYDDRHDPTATRRKAALALDLGPTEWTDNRDVGRFGALIPIQDVPCWHMPGTAHFGDRFGAAPGEEAP